MGNAASSPAERSIYSERNFQFGHSLKKQILASTSFFNQTGEFYHNIFTVAPNFPAINRF